MQSEKTLFSLLTALFLMLSQISVGQHIVNQELGANHVNFSTFNHNSDISKGYWFASFENNLVCLQLMDSNNRNNPSFTINFCVPKNQFKTISSSEGFELVRDSGTLVFRGGSLSSKEAGDFTFKRNGSFETFLNKEGIAIDDDGAYYFKMFLGNINRGYVLGVKKEGYQPTVRELGKMGLHGVSLAYLKDLGNTKYKGLELEMVAKFAIHDVSIPYLKKLKESGYGDIDANMVKKFAIHDINIDYINGLSKLGYGNLDANMLKNFAIHSISLSYIKSLADVGYGNLEPNMLKKFAVHSISANYIRSLKKTGISNPDANTIKKAKVHSLKAHDIERAMANGHDSKDLSDYIKLKIHGK